MRRRWDRDAAWFCGWIYRTRSNASWGVSGFCGKTAATSRRVCQHVKSGAPFFPARGHGPGHDGPRDTGSYDDASQLRTSSWSRPRPPWLSSRAVLIGHRLPAIRTKTATGMWAGALLRETLSSGTSPQGRRQTSHTSGPGNPARTATPRWQTTSATIGPVLPSLIRKACQPSVGTAAAS
jgi:hypothetical protein